MNQLIVAVVLDSLLVLANSICAAVIIVWRHKRFRMQIHMTGSGLVFFAFSLILSSLGVLMTHLVFLPSERGLGFLVLSVFLCPIGIVGSLHDCCFCIFIDGKCAVSRTLLSERKIDLSLPGTNIYDNDALGFSIVGVVSNEGETIKFNRRRVSGNASLFVETCRSIQSRESRAHQ